MKLDRFNYIVEHNTKLIKQAKLSYRLEQVDGAIKLPYTYIRINAGTEYDVLYHIKCNKWHVVNKNSVIRVPGSNKGRTIAGAIRSAATRKQQSNKQRSAEKRVKQREKAYNKQTPANVLHKLTRATAYYKQDNLSMSKAARHADVDYETFKDYLNNPKKYQPLNKK